MLNLQPYARHASVTMQHAVRMQRTGAVGRAFTAARPVVRLVARASRRIAQPGPRYFSALARAAADESDLLDFSDFEDGLSSAPAALPMSAAETENVKLRIRMRGYSVSLLQQAVDQVAGIAESTGAIFRGPVMLPTKRKVFCVLRSPHVDKDAREHFEIRTHNRLLDLGNLSAETVQAMMSWVPPSGLQVECSIV